jgi:hypothetical protein
MVDPLRGPVPVDRLGRAERRTLERGASVLLVGVGGDVERMDLWRAGIHLRAPLTDEEIAGLAAEFLSCPAVDIAGGENGVERPRSS